MVLTERRRQQNIIASRRSSRSPTQNRPARKPSVVIDFLQRLFRFGLRRNAKSFLVVVLHCRRKFVEVGEKARDFPDILLAKSLVPSGHSRVTDSSANRIENVPLGVVGRIGDQV